MHVPPLLVGASQESHMNAISADHLNISIGKQCIGVGSRGARGTVAPLEFLVSV